MLTKKELVELVEDFQEIQKRNPPSSIEWLKASREIHALARMIVKAQ